jgi:hypothetical protein
MAADERQTLGEEIIDRADGMAKARGSAHLR